MSNTINGFMVMPYFTDKEKREKDEKGKSEWSDVLTKKDKCYDFFKNIIKVVCDELSVDIKLANEVLDEQDIVLNIQKEIECSDVIIVDLTLLRPNVLYELGMAHCMDYNKTLLITQDDYDGIPFDIKHMSIMKYGANREDYGNFKKKLKGIIDYINKKIIYLGISPYPELMILKKKIQESDLPYKIEVREIPWNQTFSVLHENGADNYHRVDLVVGNADLCEKNNKAKTEYIYRGDLLQYNSFYLIANSDSYKSYDEVCNENPRSEFKELIKKTFDQFNGDQDVTIFASGMTDHKENFEKFNSLFACDGKLIKKYTLLEKGGPKEILSDFIDSRENGLFIGGIPERINLLKSKDKYKLIIDYKQIKSQKDTHGVISYLQQRNGIVYRRTKDKEIKSFEHIIDMIYELWHNTYEELVEYQVKRNIYQVNDYLSAYNSTNYVRAFGHNNNICLIITAEDFINNYINKLVFIEK